MKNEKKVKRLYSLKESTVKAIEAMAEKESRKLSTIIDLAIEQVYKQQEQN